MAGIKVGIDLGTTYSAIAYVDDSGTPRMIETDWGEDTTPSVVAVTDDGYIVGHEAKEFQASGTENAFSTFKRFMGSSHRYYAGDREFSPEELSSMLLKRMKEVAEKVSGKEIEGAVITCPAYFNEFQRKATKKAGEDAGLKVLDLVNEPTAASVYYGFKKGANGTLMTFDLGGGTFDITILDIADGNITVKATKGDSALGGKNWDSELCDIVSAKFQEETGDSFENDKEFMCKMIVDSEKMKKELSSRNDAKMRINYGGSAVTISVSRDEFEEATSYLVDKTISICRDLLAEMGMKWSDIDHVLLVGGSTRMPAVRSAIKNESKTDVIIHEDTDLAVAKGAALLANAQEGKIRIHKKEQGMGVRTVNMSFKDVTPFGLGTLVTDPGFTKYLNKIMIARNSAIPAKGRRTVKIQPGNYTTKLDIYTIQGESENPLDVGNKVLYLTVAKEIENDGDGVEIDIDYEYDRSGMVKVTAYQGERLLKMETGVVPDNCAWMGRPPVAEKIAGGKKYIILTIDLSGSMSGNPLKEAINEMCKFAKMIKDAEFALVAFADSSKEVSGFTTPGNILSKIESLNSVNVGGGTSCNPLNKQVYSLAKSVAGKGKVFVVTLTDGQWYGDNTVESSIKSLKELKVECIGIGFGDVDRTFIRKISSSDKSALKASFGGLGRTLSSIASDISGSK